MLGRDVLARLNAEGMEAVGLTHRDLDVTDAGVVTAAVDRYRPGVVVNCAAWTAVDAAESQEAAAQRVNRDGPANLARACARTGSKLIQVSTDYVFSGNASIPYAEDALPHPRTAYGRTKLAGERAVLDRLPDSGCVVRTAWLYGAHGHNFVTAMLRLESTRSTLDVVDDQRGQPTWTADLAEQLIAVGRAPTSAGIYHVTNLGEATWCAFARKIFALLGADERRVRPTTSTAYTRPAPRPAYSVLASTRTRALELPPPRHWSDALTAAWPQLVGVRDAYQARQSS